jgi:hypothetical protein
MPFDRTPHIANTLRRSAIRTQAHSDSRHRSTAKNGGTMRNHVNYLRSGLIGVGRVAACHAAFFKILYDFCSNFFIPLTLMLIHTLPPLNTFHQLSIFRFLPYFFIASQSRS